MKEALQVVVLPNEQIPRKAPARTLRGSLCALHLRMRNAMMLLSSASSLVRSAPSVENPTGSAVVQPVRRFLVATPACVVEPSVLFVLAGHSSGQNGLYTLPTSSQRQSSDISSDSPSKRLWWLQRILDRYSTDAQQAFLPPAGT